MAISIPNPNPVLYCSGLFNSNNPTLNQTQLGLVQESGFTTAILWTLHVDTSGDLIYNGKPAIVSNGTFNSTDFGYLPALVSSLKDPSSSSVQLVLFSIGSGGGPQDWTNIANLLSTSDGQATLKSNFAALSSALAIDGYDFDNEDDIETGVIVSMTEMLSGNGSGNSIITYCPYDLESVWTQALVEVYNDLSSMNPQPPMLQPVQWFNLQCYAGGHGNDPVTWAKALPTNAGIADTKSFVLPGYVATSPEDVQKRFDHLAGKGINGGFIWNSGKIFDGSKTPEDYAQAILNGLGVNTAQAV